MTTSIDRFREAVMASTFDLEFQRDEDGARPQRARYNASVIDANYDLKSVDPRRLHLHLPDTYVIFITETDVLGGGLPSYHINVGKAERRGKQRDDHNVGKAEKGGDCGVL